MTNDKLFLLESVLGKSVPAHRDNYSFHCPFCGHRKPKLNVALETGIWGCWVCGQAEGSKSKGHSVSILFRRIGSDPEKIKEAKKLWNERVSINKKPTLIDLRLPDEYKPLWEPGSSFFYNKAKGYLKSRGLTDLDFFKYRIGYCNSGLYSDMVILPSYTKDGQLNFFTARSYINKSFKNPPNIDKNVIVYEDQISWSDPIVLVEGQLDAITIKRNAIPLIGKSIPSKLKMKIVEERPPGVILCLDGDAIESIWQHSKFFITTGIPVRKVELPDGHDPNSLGFEKVWEYINGSDLITESDRFTHQIKSLFK